MGNKSLFPVVPCRWLSFAHFSLNTPHWGKENADKQEFRIHAGFGEVALDVCILKSQEKMNP